jgi:hypothetical protein
MLRITPHSSAPLTPVNSTLSTSEPFFAVSRRKRALNSKVIQVKNEFRQLLKQLIDKYLIALGSGSVLEGPFGIREVYYDEEAIRVFNGISSLYEKESNLHNFFYQACFDKSLYEGKFFIRISPSSARGVYFLP